MSDQQSRKNYLDPRDNPDITTEEADLEREEERLAYKQEMAEARQRLAEERQRLDDDYQRGYNDGVLFGRGAAMAEKAADQFMMAVGAPDPEDKQGELTFLREEFKRSQERMARTYHNTMILRNIHMAMGMNKGDVECAEIFTLILNAMEELTSRD